LQIRTLLTSGKVAGSTMVARRQLPNREVNHGAQDQ
jgi:hypothetical protein